MSHIEDTTDYHQPAAATSGFNGTAVDAHASNGEGEG